MIKKEASVFLIKIIVVILGILFLLREFLLFVSDNYFSDINIAFIHAGIIFLSFFIFVEKVQFRNVFSSHPISKSQSRVYTLWAFIVLLFGLYLVLNKLWLGLVIDEQYQVEAIKGILRDGIPRYQNGFIYLRGLFYSYFTAALVNLQGLSVNETNVRLLSVGYYFSTIILLWWFIKKIFNVRVALISVILFSFSFSMISFAKLARGYAGLTFYNLLAVISLYFFIFFHKKGWLKFYVLSALLALLHHELGLILWTFPLFISKKLFKYGIFLGGILFLIIYTIKPLIGDVGIDYYGMLVDASLVKVLFSLILALFYYLMVYLPYVLLAIWGLISIVKSNLKKEIKNRYYYFYVIFVFSLVATSLGQRFSPRYVLWLFPILLIIVVFNIEVFILFLFGGIKKFYNQFYWILILFFLILNLPDIAYAVRLDYGATLPRFKVYHPLLFKYPDYKTTVQYVLNNYNSEDVVISLAHVDLMHDYYGKGKIGYQYYYGAYWNKDLGRSSTKIITNYGNLQSVIKRQEDHFVWLITDYFTDPKCDVECVRFVDEGEKRKVMNLLSEQGSLEYVGKDGISSVYVVNRREVFASEKLSN